MPYNPQFPTQNNFPAQSSIPVQLNYFQSHPLSYAPESFNVQAVIQDNIKLKGELETVKSFIADLMSKAKQSPRTFMCDTIIHYHYLIERNGKRVPIGEIEITDVWLVNPNDDNTYEAVIVEYSINGFEFTTSIPYRDFVRNNLLPYFKEFFKHPDCNKEYANELLFDLIRTYAQPKNVTIPAHPSWITITDSTKLFVTKASYPPIFYKHLPPSISERKINFTSKSTQQIKYDCDLFFHLPIKFKMLIAFRVASLFLGLLKNAGYVSSQLLLIEPSQNCNDEIIIPFIKNKNYHSTHATSINAELEDIKRELDNTFDGIAIFRDTHLFEHNTRIESNLQYIIDDLKHTVGDEYYSLHQTVIISQFLGNLLPPDDLCCISFGDESIMFTPERIGVLSEELDSYIIQVAGSSFSLLETCIIDNISNLQTSIRKLNKNMQNTYILFLTGAIVLSSVGFNIFTPNELEEAISIICKPALQSMSTNEIICKEFASIVCKLIRTGTIKVTEKKDNSEFMPNENMAIATENVLAFEPETVENFILSRMGSTRNINKLKQALKECGYLHSTNKDRYIINIYDTMGMNIRIPSYAVYRTILDKDVRLTVDNIASEEYMLTDGDIPKTEFFRFVNTSADRIAGRLMQYRDAEALHMYISGQTGFGKTFALCQIAAQLSSIEHKVLILDSSGSFSREELEKHYPTEFIDKHISLYQMEDVGIPVDIFDVSDYTQFKNKRDSLANVLLAATDRLGPVQASALIDDCSKLMYRENSRIKAVDILDLYGANDDALLDNDPDDNPDNRKVKLEKTRRSILVHIKPVLDDIISLKTAEKSWSELFDESKDIVVITTDTSSTPCGDQLLDMITASLYNHQRKHHDIALDLIIDEIQHQNFSNWSPLRKILKNGRKIHMAFIGATQEFYSKGNSIGDAMSKADIKVFFKPVSDTINEVAEALHISKAEMRHTSKFRSMERGDCFIKSPFYSKKLKRNISDIIISGSIYKFIEPPAVPDESEMQEESYTAQSSSISGILPSDTMDKIFGAD